MSRTKGSGWGGGTLLYQKCPLCNKKKVIYDTLGHNVPPYKCTACRERFIGNDELVPYKYVSHYNRVSDNEQKEKICSLDRNTKFCSVSPNCNTCDYYK